MSELLYISDLTFCYNGAAEPVLKGLSLSLAPGEFCLLSGANGSGKSTLLRLIKPEVAPAGSRTGQLCVGGQEVAGFSIAESAQRIAYVSQAPQAQLVCDVVWHEVAFGLESLGVEQAEMRRRVAQVATFLGIEHLMDRTPQELSGGEAQLVALASAVVLEPALLLLDEPTSMLDPVARDTFAHALFRLSRRLNIGIVVATHDPALLAPYASSAYTLADGTLTREDPNELATRIQTPQLSAARQAALKTFFTHYDAAHAAHTPQDSSTPQADKPVLLAHDLWYRYGRRSPWVLKAAGMSLVAGEATALLGGNGSGKSTLLQALIGLVKPQRGRVQRGRELSVAYLPQEPELVLGANSVAEELFAASEAERASVLAACGLEAAATADPLMLSGGQRQLVALVKTLVSHAQVLVLDEPLVGLDPESREVALALLQHAKKRGAALVCVTHESELTRRVATKVALLFNGEVSCVMDAQSYLDRTIFFA